MYECALPPDMEIKKTSITDFLYLKFSNDGALPCFGGFSRPATFRQLPEYLCVNGAEMGKWCKASEWIGAETTYCGAEAWFEDVGLIYRGHYLHAKLTG